MSTVRGTVIKKLISMLTADSTIQNYVAGRIYAAHISTIQDYKFPAISIHLLSGTGRDTAGPFMDNLTLQIEPWFDSVEASNNTWDDVVELHEKILDVLHRMKGTDVSLGLTVLEITNVNEPQQITDQDGTMHYPSLWKIKATM